MKGLGSSSTSLSFSEPCYSFRKGKVAVTCHSPPPSLPRPRLLQRVTELAASDAAVEKWDFKDVAEIRPRPGLGRRLFAVQVTGRKKINFLRGSFFRKALGRGL